VKLGENYAGGRPTARGPKGAPPDVTAPGGEYSEKVTRELRQISAVGPSLRLILSPESMSLKPCAS
jgi:hypothetical protein